VRQPARELPACRKLDASARPREPRRSCVPGWPHQPPASRQPPCSAFTNTALMFPSPRSEHCQQRSRTVSAAPGGLRLHLAVPEPIHLPTICVPLLAGPRPARHSGLDLCPPMFAPRLPGHPGTGRQNPVLTSLRLAGLRYSSACPSIPVTLVFRKAPLSSGLLIRGFGVQVPGGAPGLTWGFTTPGHFLCVCFVRLCAPRVLGGRERGVGKQNRIGTWKVMLTLAISA
jgi:hypothetical protein